jgi:PadR family transcriptional regulator PadR
VFNNSIVSTTGKNSMKAQIGRKGTLSYNATLLLQALVNGHGYGFEVMKIAALPSGTVYPLLRRLEASGLVSSRWEETDSAHQDGRPARRYYEASPVGKKALVEARQQIAAQQAALFGDLPAAGDMGRAE